MAGWTDPFDWTAGLIPTIGQLNAALRDNLRASGGPRSTTPPTATNEQMWFYPADTTNGVVWALKYNSGSASAYKWECVGGASMCLEVATDETTASTTYVDLATVGPSITVPRAGDYEVEWGASVWNATGGVAEYVAVKRGAAATADADAATVSPAQAAPGTSIARKKVFTGLAASDVLKLQCKVNGGTGHFIFRWISVRPVRVS